MTQHEYVFVAISIVLGLAITRLLHTVGMLIRAHRFVTFHWATTARGLCVMSYSLQMWWVGWGLSAKEVWTFGDYAVLTAGAIFVYGAAEMALPAADGQQDLDFLRHSQGLGRLSALSMLLYFAIGPYVNIVMFGNDMLASLLFPVIGMVLTALMIALPRIFPLMAVLFTIYTAVIITLTV